MIDWRSDEFQEILDIKPVKVEQKSKPKDKSVTEDGEKFQFLNGTGNILDYFGLPDPKKCAEDVVEKISKIARKLKRHTTSPNEFFEFLVAIEGHYEKETDKHKRLDNVWHYLKTHRTGLKQHLVDDHLLDKDVLEDKAKETGNWKQYLASVNKEQEKIRK